MKYFSLALIFISFKSYGQLHKSCEAFSKNKTHALKITKTFNAVNELMLDIELDNQSCQFKSVSRPLSIYWEMGKKSSGLAIPCENLLLKEVREIFGYNNHDEMYGQIIQHLVPDTIVANMPALANLPRQVGSKDELSSQVRFVATKEAGRCQIATYLEMNRKQVKVDRIHSIIRYLKLQKIEFYNKGQLVRSF